MFRQYEKTPQYLALEAYPDLVGSGGNSNECMVCARVCLRDAFLRGFATAEKAIDLCTDELVAKAVLEDRNLYEADKQYIQQYTPASWQVL